MAKKKSKLKSALKKIGKAAAVAGAGYLAMKGLKNRKDLAGTEDGKGGMDTTRRALQAMTSNDAYNDDTMPGNLSRNMGQKRKQFMPGIVDYMSKGGRAGKKTKPKSIGKALRGGGKVIR